MAHTAIILDDDELSCLLLKSHLHQLGLNPVILETIDPVQISAANPALILIDEAHGVELVRSLRASGHSELVVAMLHAQPPEQWRDAGCSVILQQPVTRADLAQMLTDHALDDAADPELQALFVRSAQTNLALLEQAREAGDRARIVKLAHKIRGSAASYGFVELGEVAAAVEDASRADALDEQLIDALMSVCRDVAGTTIA